MKDIRFINLDQLENYEPKFRISLIRRYHSLYTQKYRWFVRPLKGRAYYCNGERPNEIGVEIFDCDWTPEQWDTRPYRHFYNPIQDAWYESYARHGLPPLSEYNYGYGREDSLITKNGKPWYYGMFRDGNTSAHYWVESDDIWITHKGSHTNYYGASGKHTQGATFSTTVDVKKPLTEPIMAAAKALNKRKFNGVYRPFIDKLVELYGLNHTQI